MRKAALVIALALVLTACAAGAAAPVRVALDGPRSATAGRAWTAQLTVRPTSFRGVIRVVATGPARVAVRATRSGGSYRVRLVFPSSGRWTLTARAGGSVSRVGIVTVRKPPLTFAWPTSVALEPDGALLVVENGRRRVLRVHPETGRVTVVAEGLANPFAAVRAPSGAIFITGGRTLRRLDPAGTLHDVVTADEDIGPLTLSPDGDVVYTSSTRLFLLPDGGGSPRVLTTGLNSAHGVAVAPDGTVLVSDTSNNRVLRVDPRTGAASTVVETGEPRGLDVAADGTITLVEAGSKRVGRFDSTGRRLARVGPSFGDPYDVAIDDDGTAYVVDTAAAGRIVRVTVDGRAEALPTG
jgi:streptogramin lyase